MLGYLYYYYFTNRNLKVKTLVDLMYEEFLDLIIQFSHLTVKYIYIQVYISQNLCHIIYNDFLDS